MSDSASESWIEWGSAGRPLPGQRESADRSFVELREDAALLAVIDGLGHGEDAARAADAAVAALSAHSKEALVALVASCHAALAGTRGAVMSLAVVDVGRSTIAWLGVGDVEGVLHRSDGRPRETILLKAGVLGDRLPPLRAVELPLAPGDTLVLATDGIRRAFVDEPSLRDPPGELARRILKAYARPTDDALVLVARYTGRGGA